MNLYKYEIYNLDANKISNEICNDIFDLFNLKLNINNTGKSIAFEKNKYIKLLSKGNSQKINDRYNFLIHKIYLQIYQELKELNQILLLERMI